MIISRIARPVVALTAVALLAGGCGSLGNQFLGNPDASPPARPSIPVGHGYANAVRYLASHSQRDHKGMISGILVGEASPAWASQNLNGGAWRGVIVVPGGRVERVSSDAGDNGMAAYASIGDMISFPASGPVDAPSDNGYGKPARVLVAGAVNVP
jgi:hypothetical protein